MITPTDLQLPEKFKEFRINQLNTAMKIAHNEKFGYLLDSPTGTGKSIIAATVQRLRGKNVVYLCTTKQLQDQLVTDFPYARVLKGRSNYRCNKYFNMWPDITAEMCNDSQDDECAFKGSCEYNKAKRAALMAPIAILNMAYFLTECNYGKTFSGTEYVIIDELDTTEDQLMSFVELKITKSLLDYLQIQEPQYKTKFESWIPWAEHTYTQIQPEIVKMQTDMGSDWYTPNPKDARHYLALTRLSSKLSFFIHNVDNTWVFYPADTEWTFKPIWISAYAQNSLWRHMKKMLGMSATILEPYQAAKNIGLKDFDYLALPSPFPKENRPVIYDPCGNVIRREMAVALPRMANKMYEILSKHPNDKILVHTVSYEVQKYLMEHVQSDRLMAHTPKDKQEKLKLYKESDKPLVILSPSMDRGVDLPYDQCRVVVIAKIPYPNLADEQIKKRLYASKDGSFWYAYNTIKTVIQMAGRGVRAVDDYAVTYILDEQFERLYNDNKKIFPKWFTEALAM
jgi:ATP-dependent DNA helicase DinG